MTVSHFRPGDKAALWDLRKGTSLSVTVINIIGNTRATVETDDGKRFLARVDWLAAAVEDA